tara:strand:- start:116 stop:742 length:627 start_codon:yes stop_codon:yes gene_type:complete
MFKKYELPDLINFVYFHCMENIFLQEFDRYPAMWTFILSCLIALAYAAYKIKKEPNDYLIKSSALEFQHFILKVPSWWSLTVNNKSLIRFERLDTRYDWYAEYSNYEGTDQQIEDILGNLITELKIVFDDKDNFESFSIDSLGRKESIRVARMEGMSTIDGIERAYFDIFVAKYKESTIIGKSHSSILNGCVEGPYFEEVLQRLTPVP